MIFVRILQTLRKFILLKIASWIKCVTWHFFVIVKFPSNFWVQIISTPFSLLVLLHNCHTINLWYQVKVSVPELTQNTAYKAELQSLNGIT